MANRTVIVVDPNAATAQRVTEALAGAPFLVRAAATAPEAEALLEGGDVAALVAAVAFPKGNGYDIAKLAKQRHPAAATFLVTGGFEIYQAARAEAALVDGRLTRPLTAESVRRQFEAILGPLAAEIEPEALAMPLDAVEPVEVSEPRSPPARSAHAIADERVASFLPRDWAELPLVRVDPLIVGPAVERAIIELLPEVVEAVLRKTLLSSRAFQDLIEGAVDEAVRDQVPALARRVIAERLAELEAKGGG